MGAANQREYNSSREIDWPGFRRITELGCFMRELGEVDRQDPALCLSRWDGEVRISTGRDMTRMIGRYASLCRAFGKVVRRITNFAPISRPTLVVFSY